jgi:hypothetical protein
MKEKKEIRNGEIDWWIAEVIDAVIDVWFDERDVRFICILSNFLSGRPTRSDYFVVYVFLEILDQA